MKQLIEHLKILVEKICTNETVDSYRVFHGRGRTHPGLEFITIDFFQPVILVTLFSEVTEQWLEQVTSLMQGYLGKHEVVCLIQRRYLLNAPSEIVWGSLPVNAYARRGGQIFSLHLAQQQNIGFFLDMEPGRKWVVQNVAGKRVLNLFAYTCTFSVIAIAAGAEKVVNVDMSSSALNTGRENHRLNNLDKTRSEFLAEDILKSWGRIKKRGPYDVVVIDPPTFQKGSFVAEKDYGKVLRRLPELMPMGGLALACLNAPELDTVFLKQEFAIHCPAAVFLERLTPHQDFPDVDPEQQLKLLIYQLPC